MKLTKGTEKLLAFAFGVVFVIFLLVIALAIPSPTAFQLSTFNIVLALAAAGCASMIPGFLAVEIPNSIRAGGAMAVFVIVFFFKPAAMVTTAWTTIPADPDNLGAELITYQSPEATSKNAENIEDVQFLPSTREFRVTFKKGFTDGWFVAYHANLRRKEQYWIKYEFRGLRIVKTTKTSI